LSCLPRGIEGNVNKVSRSQNVHVNLGLPEYKVGDILIQQQRSLSVISIQKN